jgi:hypothetical protein
MVPLESIFLVWEKVENRWELRAVCSENEYAEIGVQFIEEECKEGNIPPHETWVDEATTNHLFAHFDKLTLKRLPWGAKD